MNFTAIILLCACLTVSAKSNSQTVTLSEKNAPLEKVFKEIKKQTGFTFFVNDALMNKAEKITIEVKNAPLQTALDLCFKQQPLTYAIVGKTIVVKEKLDEQKKEDAIEIVQANIDIKGRITNEDGEPVRATVTVKGTSIAVGTNDNGEFVLRGVNEDATLIITGVNIDPIEIKVNKKRNLKLL